MVAANTDQEPLMRVRTYGQSGHSLVALHGGPAARGSAAPVARSLADSFRVFEPWQRGSSDQPLTVARHVADLHDLIETRCDGARPAIVGESWGAMLALAYAAAHPHTAGPLVLIGCGTFDLDARARMRQLLAERTDDDLQRQLDRLPHDIPDPQQRLKRMLDLTLSLYAYDPVPDDPNADPEARDEPFDTQAHTETWNDMLRQQELGLYPAAFAAITSPVLMLHGDYDPHPGDMIRDSLIPHIPHLEYRQWDRCGHSPSQERWARDEFVVVMRDWLTQQFANPAT